MAELPGHTNKRANIISMIPNIWCKVRSVSLESWKIFFEIGGIGLVLFTFLFGAGAWYTGNRVNAEQAERLRNFDEQLAKQKERTAIAERELESERIARLELQNSMSARTLAFNGETSRRLGRFAGTPFVLSVINGSDSEFLAFQISSALGQAKWIDRGRVPFDDRLTGVTIRLGQKDNAEQDDPRKLAAAELAEYFGANRIESTVAISASNLKFPDGIIISIGAKPAPFNMTREFAEAVNDEHKEIIKKIEKAKFDQMEHLRKVWKLPPYDKPSQ